MKCHGCGTAMLLEKSESGSTSNSRASIQWHSCPLCGKNRLLSQLDVDAEPWVARKQPGAAAQSGGSAHIKPTRRIFA